MTTSQSALDAQHGRQGGRIVPWKHDRPKVGEHRRTTLELGADIIEVLEVLPGGRIVARFPTGGTLTIPDTDTTTTGATT